MAENILDRAIAAVAPGYALRRLRNRITYEVTKRGYDAVASARVNGRKAPSTGPNAEVRGGGAYLRRLSREARRNAPPARSAIAKMVTATVGTGITPRAATGDEKLDRALNDGFPEWSRECLVGTRGDFTTLQVLAATSMFEGGETLTRRRRRQSRDGLFIPVQAELMEPDFLDEQKFAALADGYVFQGVEFDRINRLRNFWLFDHHPGDRSVMSAARRLESKPVAAADMAHLYVVERIGQVRGIPWLCAVLLGIAELGEYRLAEQTRKKLEASVAAFITPGAGEDDGNLPPGGITGTVAERPGAYDAHGQLLETIEPGTIATLRGGRDIRFNTPSHNQSYPDYVRAELQQIAAGALMTYELLTGDLSNTNYSSIRAGRNDFRAMIEQIQWAFFIPMQCDPLWRWYVDGMYAAGRIPRVHYGVEWDPPGFVSVDPYKDALTDLIEIRAGLTSEIAAIAKRGYHHSRVLAEHAQWKAAVDKAGLVFDTDVSRVTKAGAANGLSNDQMDRMADMLLRVLEAEGDPEAANLRALYQAAANSKGN